MLPDDQDAQNAENYASGIKHNVLFWRKFFNDAATATRQVIVHKENYQNVNGKQGHYAKGTVKRPQSECRDKKRDC